MRLARWIACAALSSPLAAHEALDERIAALTARLRSQPANAVLLVERAELHRLHGDLRAALADLEAACSSDVVCNGLALARARVLAALERREEAEAALDAHLALHPKDAEALLERARLRVARSAFEAAESDFAAAVAELARPAPETWLAYARAVAARGATHLERAVRVLELGLERGGECATLQLAALELDIERGAFDSGLTRIERLQRGSARTELWLARRGDVLARAGRADEARAAWEAALVELEKLPPRARSTRSARDFENELRAKLAGGKR